MSGNGSGAVESVAGELVSVISSTRQLDDGNGEKQSGQTESRSVSTSLDTVVNDRVEDSLNIELPASKEVSTENTDENLLASEPVGDPATTPWIHTEGCKPSPNWIHTKEEASGDVLHEAEAQVNSEHAPIENKSSSDEAKKLNVISEEKGSTTSISEVLDLENGSDQEIIENEQPATKNAPEDLLFAVPKNFKSEEHNIAVDVPSATHISTQVERNTTLLEVEKDETAEELEVYKKQIQELRSKVEQYENKKAENNPEVLVERLKSQENIVCELKNKLKEKQAALDAAKAHHASLTSRIINLQAKEEENNNKLTLKQEQVNELEARITELTASYEQENPPHEAFSRKNGVTTRNAESNPEFSEEEPMPSDVKSETSDSKNRKSSKMCVLL